MRFQRLCRNCLATDGQPGTTRLSGASKPPPFSLRVRWAADEEPESWVGWPYGRIHTSLYRVWNTGVIT